MKHGLSAFECKMDMALQVPAGSDTSVTTIRGILLHLFSSPVIYRKLKDEISLAIDEDRISDPVTHEEAMKLPLLNVSPPIIPCKRQFSQQLHHQAVILEGMRLSPATTVGFPKVVPPGGDMILGRRVPAGTELYGNMVMIGQNEKIFGSDIAVFRPERFLEGDTETRQRRMRTVDLGFGAGRWMCLGKALAQMEMRKLLVQLLRNFDFQIVNPEMPWKKKAFVVFLIDDFVVKVSKV
jgi:cytochrome P450